jgi:hypothetical protein
VRCWVAVHVSEVCVQNGEFCSNAGSLNHSIKCNNDMYILCEFKNILYDVKVSPNYFVHALSHVFRWQCVDRFKWSNQHVCSFIQRCTSQLVYVRVSYVLYIQPANYVYCVIFLSRVTTQFIPPTFRGAFKRCGVGLMCHRTAPPSKPSSLLSRSHRAHTGVCTTHVVLCCIEYNVDIFKCEWPDVPCGSIVP